MAVEILKNTPRTEVATKTDVSGPVENPRASTWVMTLFTNAFFDAVLPALEGKPLKGGNSDEVGFIMSEALRAGTPA